MSTRRATATSNQPHRCKALVLQGGGALGSYQGGVYEALSEQNQLPKWVAGVSIGAINAALIAGNAPEKRVERLHEFWSLVSSGAPQRLPPWIADRSTLNQLSASLATMFGIPGFFKPRMSPEIARGGQAKMLSYYDTQPLKATLERLVDFDRINAQEVRLSVGAVNICSGNAIYFDNTKQKIGPQHIMASGALPPGFAPVEVDGEFYWDGGLVSNTPLQYLLDNHPRDQSLVVMQVDLFNSRGTMPVTMSDVMTRQKDIIYSSRTRMNTDTLAANVNLQQAIADLIAKLPPALRKDASVQAVHAQLTTQPIDIFHLIYRDKPYEGDSKDYEFSRATVEDHWEVGMRDVRRALTQPEALVSNAQANGVTTYDLGELDAIRIKRPLTPPSAATS